MMLQILLRPDCADAIQSPLQSPQCSLSSLVQVPTSICNEKCPAGTRKSTLSEKSNCCYSCLPCPGGEMSMTPDSATCEKCPEDQWPNRESCQCIPKTLDFLPYHEPLISVLAVCTALLFLLALATS
eukprot:bmy_21362T0